MCGISGAFSFNSSPIQPELIRLMTDALTHRGPDHSDSYIDNNLALGHNRLSIIDLSANGNQPMTSSNQQFVISWNGECYNYLELREDLQKQGVEFKTESDTEVVLEGLSKYGFDFIQRINGMFAFALWDKTKRELIIARDRLGIKPCYYTIQNNTLYFASEIKAILAAGVKAESNPDALYWHLKLRYSPGRETIFKNIFKLEAGHSLKVGNQGQVQDSTFWDLESRYNPDSSKDSAETFYELLYDSVKLRYRSDEEVGAFLSGGIDSSTLVGLSKKLGYSPNTFTLKVAGRLDETTQARELSSLLKLTNYPIGIQPEQFDLIDKIISSLEEPLADSIILPTYLLMQAASKRHKVMLSGEGADEVLAGYVHHLALHKLNSVRDSAPSFLLPLLSKVLLTMPSALIDRLNPYPSKFGKDAVNRITQVIGSTSIFDQNLNLMSLFDDQEIEGLTGQNVPKENPFREFWGTRTNSQNFLGDLMKQDLKYWCPDYTLLRVDKLSMAHGLEVRVPFLDHRIVEHCLHQRAKDFISGNGQKLLLRRALRGKQILPDKIIRRKKSPFILPLDEAFNGGIPDRIYDTLKSQQFKENSLINPMLASSLISKKTPSSLEVKKIFAVYCMEIWRQRFLK